MDDKTQILIGVGVAFAIGTMTLLESYIQKAKDLGVSSDELTEVFNTVRSTRLSSSIEMDSFAEKRSHGPQTKELKILTPNGTTCGCGPEGCC